MRTLLTIAATIAVLLIIDAVAFDGRNRQGAWREAQTQANLFNYNLKSTSFCSRGQAENPHILGVLALGDEFRERIAFCGTHEKIGKCLAQRSCHDKRRWREIGINASHPGP